MFDIGWSEGLLLLFVLILVVPPAKLPQLMHDIGTLYGKCIRLYHAFMNEITALSAPLNETDSPDNTVDYFSNESKIDSTKETKET